MSGNSPLFSRAGDTSRPITAAIMKGMSAFSGAPPMTAAKSFQKKNAAVRVRPTVAMPVQRPHRAQRSMF
ncbi:hypothetical protein BXU09_18230 [Deinococcus sp. LM3]|nr:hypothetical protein BXU09_18230 [Deinococcus sp. LM3]